MDAVLKTQDKTAVQREKTRTRVCVFCQTWESGGIESFLTSVLTRMDLSRLEIDLVAEQLRESIYTPQLQAHGIRLLELSGSLHRIVRNGSAFRRLLRERAYDIVHLNIYQSLSLYYARIAREEGVPVRIAHSHNTALRKSAGKGLKEAVHGLSKAFFSREATDLWACSRAAAEFMFSRRALSAKDYLFVPNGIDTERFRFRAEVRRRVRRELGTEDRFVIGNVGRLCYQKNQSFLLDVFAQLLKTRPDSVLLLVGDGPDRSMLEEKAKALGLADRLIFYGVSERVEELLWAMDVFVFPSRFEGFGIVAVEAQAAGLPTICSEHVQPEACVTPYFQSLPLDERESGPWAEAILRAQEASGERKESDILLDSPFSIDNTVELVRRNWDR